MASRHPISVKKGNPIVNGPQVAHFGPPAAAARNISQKSLKVTIVICVEFAKILSFPMKNTIITTALVAIIGLAFVGAPVTAQAQTTNSTTATAPAKPKKIQYKGSITAIDASSVTVASKEKTLTLAITGKTQFKVDKAGGTLADFAVGDAVTGSYTTDSTGALSAASIHKKKAASTSTATKSSSTTNAPAATAPTQ